MSQLHCYVQIARFNFKILILNMLNDKCNDLVLRKLFTIFCSIKITLIKSNYENLNYISMSIFIVEEYD